MKQLTLNLTKCVLFFSCFIKILLFNLCIISRPFWPHSWSHMNMNFEGSCIFLECLFIGQVSLSCQVNRLTICYLLARKRILSMRRSHLGTEVQSKTTFLLSFLALHAVTSYDDTFSNLFHLWTILTHLLSSATAHRPHCNSLASRMPPRLHCSIVNTENLTARRTHMNND